MILLISANFLPEPVVAASLSDDLANLLAESHKVMVLSPRPSRPLGYSFETDWKKGRKYEHTVLHSYTYPASKLHGRMLEYYSFGRHAARYIRQNHKGISCCYVSSWPLFGQYLIIRELKKHSIPAVVHVQDVYPESLSDKIPLLKKLFISTLLPIDKYVLENSARIVAISPKMKSYIVRSRKLSEGAISVIFNWQHEDKFLEYRRSGYPDKRSEPFTFMFLGSFNRTSSLDLVIRSFGHSGLKDSQLIFAGSGPEKSSLIALADSYKNINIRFMEAPACLVPEIQGQADVLVLNLKKEAANYSLPSKLVAYMFSARPVLACLDEESDAAAVIREARCGWIVPPEDMATLAETMRKVAACDPSELKEMGEKGFRYAIRNFSSVKNVHKLAALVVDTVNHQ